MPLCHAGDAAPLDRRQLRALLSGAGRELAWGLCIVEREVASWKAHATRIPVPELRSLALESLDDKRSLTEGAARFWEIASRRDGRLLRLLVAFQVMANYLDTVSEHGQRDLAVRTLEPSSIMEAFVDAVVVGPPTRDYYRDYPAWDDAGYLLALVEACRSHCTSLPGYPRVRTRIAEHARLAGALDLHHDPDPERRDRALRQFVSSGSPDDGEAPWFERAAGASSALNVLVLLALATEAEARDADFDAAISVYTKVGALSMLLDSFADQFDDAVSGHVSVVAHYADADEARHRIGFLIDRSLRDAARLRHGPRHVVLVAMMIAMFLSRDSARSPPLRDDTAALVAAGGTLTRRLVPVLRLWRVLSRLQGG